MFLKLMGRPLAVASLLLSGLLGGSLYAAPGVGVSVGSIVVDDALRPGGDYDLPAIGVINTGDELREYELTYQAVSADGARQPEPGWFHFQPRRFVLQPGESQMVETRIVLPTGAEPGTYFGHLEARPVSAGNFSISIAAATKLSFTIESAGWLDAQRHRLNRWLDDFAPWTYVLPLAMLAGFLVWRARKVPYRIRLERK